MAENKEPASKVSIQQRKDGAYFFSLTFRGVTYPAKGPFPNPFEAAAVGQATLKALEAGANRFKR